MAGARTYGFLHARVRGFMPRLADADALRDLIHQPPEGQTALLNRWGLPAMLIEGGEEPAELEQTLISQLVAEAEALIRPLTGAPREALTHWMRRFELINLKVLLRGKGMSGATQDLRPQLVAMGALDALPVEELLHTEDVPDLLRHLEGTVYAPAARHAERVYAEQRRLFDVEATLDRDYYSGLAQGITRLKAADREALAPLIGRILDEVNLVWLLRYRFAMGLAPAHTFFLLVSSPFGISGGQLQQLARQESLTDVIATLPSDFYEQLADCTTVNAVEDRLAKATAASADHLLRRRVFQPGQALAYLLLRQRQFQAIHAVLKGERLGLDDDLIRGAAGLAG